MWILGIIVLSILILATWKYHGWKVALVFTGAGVVTGGFYAVAGNVWGASGSFVAILIIAIVLFAYKRYQKSQVKS
ncbi:hypothetical protein [Pleionea sp. CnH1-48]|uniref:hypothetical protein n=1 Tax=Pleionea sp. CnH1-48 TaxID=2954494 RepID=UPI002097AC99|nr:hypothetical protein [Pleionea sp. CnH1-48]MCO7227572.1 hypothetical protein [Pleionea sp. CnH1-48]